MPKTAAVSVGPVTKDVELEFHVAPVAAPGPWTVHTVPVEHLTYDPVDPIVGDGETVTISGTADDGFEITGYTLDGEEVIL